MVALINVFALKHARIKNIDDIVYTWRTNKESLTRVKNPLTRFNVLLSYIDGIATSFNFAMTNGEYDKSVLKNTKYHTVWL